MFLKTMDSTPKGRGSARHPRSDSCAGPEHHSGVLGSAVMGWVVPGTGRPEGEPHRWGPAAGRRGRCLGLSPVCRLSAPRSAGRPHVAPRWCRGHRPAAGLRLPWPLGTWARGQAWSLDCPRATGVPHFSGTWGRYGGSFSLQRPGQLGHRSLLSQGAPGLCSPTAGSWAHPSIQSQDARSLPPSCLGRPALTQKLQACLQAPSRPCQQLLPMVHCRLRVQVPLQPA